MLKDILRKFYNHGLHAIVCTIALVLFLHHNNSSNNFRDKAGYKISGVIFTPEEVISIVKTDKHIAFPSIARLNDNSLFLVYREGVSHIGTEGKIMKQFGSSDGKLWSSPEILYDQPDMDERDPTLTLSKEGDIFLNYFKYLAGNNYSTPTCLSIHVQRSSDNGKNFTPSVRVDDGSLFSKQQGCFINENCWTDSQKNKLYYYACSAPVVQSGDKFIVPAYGGEPIYRNQQHQYVSPRSRIVFFESEDKGNTWKKRLINPFRLVDSYLSEPSLIRLRSNIMLMHIRVSEEAGPGGKGRMNQTISVDGGITWTPYTPFDFIGQAPTLYQLRSGVLVSAFRLKEDNNHKEKDHHKTAFIYSMNDGKTWSSLNIIYDSDDECGYPAIVELENNKMMIIYYINGGKGVEGKVFKMDNIYEPV